ncbi:hypothetical protein L5515_011267 [Caenorhabditis briggsae]|uniref:aECM cysteine-cradle domain-containing protein n=1 Tax=Caenorhabditis briggsae TaxID=6238 RepID=A0AAE9EPD6_CAEBR|nr:hypothetical protein L5515_011267 [Caenorhabditis briggsae]
MRHLFVVLPALLAVALSQDHFIDVRSLVRDTIDAIKEVPEIMKSQNQTSTSVEPDVSTPEPQKVVKAREDVYDSLLKLPADIMSQLARDAGFVSEKDMKMQPEAVAEKKKEEVERVEKKKDDEESYSFKTVDDVKAQEQKALNDRPTLAAKKVEDDEDIFSISKLISATGNAIREAQAAQAAQQPQKTQQRPQQEPMITLPPLVPLPPVPLQMPALQMAATAAKPATEIMYRPVTKDGKTVYEQVVVVKDVNGSVKILPNTLLPQLPEEPKRVEIKQVKSDAAEFLAPTFPPMVNLFTDPTTTTTSTTTTEEPEVTSTEVPKPKRKSLPRRKIHYLEKKAKDMHSRQFGAKTVQMSDPIEIQAQEEQEPINLLQKEVSKISLTDLFVTNCSTLTYLTLVSQGSVRVYTINRKKKIRKPRIVKVEENEKVEETQVVEEEQEETTEPPKKKRKLRKSHKKEKKEKKEIRTFPDLYDEQWKTQVAPSVSPPSEEFAEQFDGVDEVQDSPKRNELAQEKPQNDTPMNDAMEQRSSKVQMFTKEQEEELLNKEVRKRVMQRIRLSKAKTSTTTTTEAPTPAPEEKEEVVKAAEEEDEEDDVIEAEMIAEEDEEEATTTTTEAPVTRARRIKKNKKRAVVTKHQCLNLRSFARQFLFDTVEEFAKEHCYFIENYYPALTCARSQIYVAKCQKWLKEE